MKSKIALVLEGGALRGIFTAGVIDCFIDNNIDFDYVVGVSAGACNTFAYVGKQKGFFKRCVFETDKKDYFYGVRQMATSEDHKFVNLSKIFNEYTKIYGFDFNEFINNKTKWEMVATNIETGEAEYLHSNDLEKAKTIGTASCSLPILTDPVEIDGKYYLDGGVADSISAKRAFDQGYDKVVVVCTRKKGSYSKIKESEKPIFNALYGKYPEFLKAVDYRTELYRKQIETVENDPRVLLIRPTLKEVSRLESNMEELSLAYYHGYTKAKEYLEQIRSW